jgi:ribosomal protein S7
MILSRDFFLLKKILHNFIKQGKKAKALNFFLSTLFLLKKKRIKTSSYNIIHKAFLNIRPVLSIQRLRKSSMLVNLPKLLGEEQQTRLCLF